VVEMSSKSRTDVINLIFDKFCFKTFLEIGTRNPADNFNKIKATTKHSVDPDPRRRYTYNMTSDEFFKKCKQKYDVIFVDGFHEEEQTYKDIKNSINFLNYKGFVVVHDCNPPYKFFTRSYKEFLERPGAWNGTVYKAFIRVKHELQKWSCFVVEENFGCGIITERIILENKLFEGDIKNITWEFFEKNRKKLLQLISFDDYELFLSKSPI